MLDQSEIKGANGSFGKSAEAERKGNCCRVNSWPVAGSWNVGRYWKQKKEGRNVHEWSVKEDQQYCKVAKHSCKGTPSEKEECCG
eukprot:7016600-Prorocentrum_lima.AAC.1